MYTVWTLHYVNGLDVYYVLSTKNRKIHSYWYSEEEAIKASEALNRGLNAQTS